MATSTIRKTSHVKRQFGLIDVQGDGTANWIFYEITFPTPYKALPLVTVMPYTTGAGTNWYPPMIDNITVNGFRFGWYAAPTSLRTMVWQAIGEVD